MKKVWWITLATAIGTLLIVLISLLPIGVVFKSIIYAILMIVYVYVVGLIMRIEK